MLVLILATIAVLAGAEARAQGEPGTNLVVEVQVASLTMSGDTAMVTYVLRNSAASAERVFKFNVHAPAPVATMLPVQLPHGEWVTHTSYRTRPIAGWSFLGRWMLPGQESPPLAFKAVGLPTIVTYWIRGYAPPPPYPSEGVPPPETDPFAAIGKPDSTVGVGPFPVNRSAVSLLGRLDDLRARACRGLRWVTPAAVCASLDAKLAGATQALGQGDTAAARSRLAGFVARLEAEHGPGLPVNDNAYWLLKVNAEYILDRL